MKRLTSVSWADQPWDPEGKPGRAWVPKGMWTASPGSSLWLLDSSSLSG